MRVQGTVDWAGAGRNERPIAIAPFTVPLDTCLAPLPAGGRQSCRYAWMWYLSGLVTYGGWRISHAAAGETTLEWVREV